MLGNDARTVDSKLASVIDLKRGAQRGFGLSA